MGDWWDKYPDAEKSQAATNWWDKYPDAPAATVQPKLPVGPPMAPAPTPTVKQGAAATLREEFTGIRGLRKIPFVGGFIGMTDDMETRIAAKRLASGWDYSKPISTQMFFEHPASKRLLREEEIVSLKMNSLRPWEIDKQLKPHPVDIYADQEKDLERVSRYIDYVTKDRTFMGKVAQRASVLPTWMLEFAMSGGMAKVGSTATKATMLKLLQKHATTKAGQAALRAAGWTGGAITRTSIGLAPRVAEKTATRQLEAEAGFRQPENWATSFAKAWGDTVIESASEEAGGAITKGLGAVAGKLPFGSKFVNGLRSAWMKATGGTADDFARKIMTKAGYSNIIGEIGEERLGTVLRALTGVEDFGAGDGANMYQRLRAGLTEDIKNLRVEAAVLSVPMAVQGGMSRLATSPAATQAGARPMVDTPAAAKSATGPTEAPAQTEATGVQGEKKDIVAPEVKPGPSTVAGPPAAPATTETGTTGEPGPTSEPKEQSEQPVVRTDQFPVQEIPIDALSLSKDVPNFKEDADPTTGVVRGEELQGEYIRLPSNPIIVWERKDGRLEVITGRHRLDLARRNGEKTIPAQIVRENDGFTLAMALTLDAESNIRDGQGKTKDYAQYFRNTEIEEDQARQRGLLRNAKGKAGFRIGKSAVDDVYSAFLGGKLSEAKAYAIANGAPNNESAQLAAAAKADKMSPDELEQYARILNRTKPSDRIKATQGNLFGFDESALIEAEAVAKEVSKEEKALKERILAVKGALRRPETARKMGLEFTDEASIRAEVARLEERLDSLKRVATNPELYDEMKRRAGLESQQQTTDVIKEQIDEITARKIKSHPALKGHAGLYFRDAGSGHAGSGRGQQAVARTAAGSPAQETPDRVTTGKQSPVESTPPVQETAETPPQEAIGEEAPPLRTVDGSKQATAKVEDAATSTAETSFTPDPTVTTEAKGSAGFAGVAGRPGGKTQKPWLDLEKTKSPNPAIEDFFGRTKKMPSGIKASKLMAKIKEGLRERFIFAHHLPSTTEAALARDMVRTMPEERKAASEKAIRDIVAVLDGDGTVQALDSVGLDLLRRKIFIQDILRKAEMDRSVSGGFSKEELEAENQRLDALIEKVPSVKKAYENRQKLWETVSSDLLRRGVLDEETAANRHYVRHFVLDLAEKNGPTGFKRKRLSEPYRAYKKERKGSTRDISTDYLEVEVRALAQIYKDNAVEDVANKIGDLADKRKDYTARAKTMNFEALVGGPENVKRIRELRSLIRESQTGPDKNDSDEKLRRKQWIQELTDLDPTYPYRQRIAMHMAKFKKGTDLGDIEEDGALFRELAKAAKDEPQSERGMAARGVFKAMAERDKMIRDALGGGYLTPERLAGQEGYVEWHYKRPNLFYRAHTLTESQIAAMVESSAEAMAGIVNIPVAQLRQALVLGRRKGMIIPDWLAAQLDDLPVNRRSPYVVRSFTKPFVQFWKRWILRVNPLRYNFRNQIGDTERLNASGQNGAIKSIPRAVRLLISKEGEYYDLMKKYGVIGSTLWHEMNDVSTIKEFERFKDYSKNKTLRQAAAKAFMLPLKTVSKIGSIEQNLTQLREDILRAAVFIDNYEKLQAGKPVRHWAGKAADIEEIAKTDKARAAAKISRETLGDYGNFTPFEEDVLRQGLMPFYSWMKINTVFWPRVLINAAKEGAAGRSFGAAATVAGINVAKWLVRALWVYAAAYLWNHRDEEAREKEESLPHWLRAMPHINVGDTTIWGQTALSDFAEWADYESLAGIAWRYDAGYLSRKEAAMEAAKVIGQAPVNKLYQSLNPYLKAPVTAISGMETYPSVFEPYFAASPASSESLKRAVLDLMGTDAKKFYQSATGDRKFEDTLYAYFAGWWGKPTDPDTLADEILKTKEWSSLKRSSPTTGRKAGQAKAGKEREWQEAQMRAEAVGPEAMRRARRRSPSRMTEADIEKLLGTGSEPTGY